MHMEAEKRMGERQTKRETETERMAHIYRERQRRLSKQKQRVLLSSGSIHKGSEWPLSTSESQELGIQSMYPLRIAGTQSLEPTSLLLKCLC